MSYDDYFVCDECVGLSACDNIDTCGGRCRECYRVYCSPECCEKAGCHRPDEEEIPDDDWDDDEDGNYASCKYCRRDVPLEISLRRMFDDVSDKGQDWKSYKDWLKAMATAIKQELTTGREVA